MHCKSQRMNTEFRVTFFMSAPYSCLTATLWGIFDWTNFKEQAQTCPRRLSSQVVGSKFLRDRSPLCLETCFPYPPRSFSSEVKVFSTWHFTFLWLPRSQTHNESRTRRVAKRLYDTAYVSTVTPPVCTTHSISKGFSKEVPAVFLRGGFSPDLCVCMRVNWYEVLRSDCHFPFIWRPPHVSPYPTSSFFSFKALLSQTFKHKPLRAP